MRLPGVDGHIGRGLQSCDAGAVLIPFREASLPALCGVSGRRVNGRVVTLRFAGINPRCEIRRGEIGKRQEEIPEIALRVDGQHGDAVDGRFLDQRDPESRLAAPGHADDDGVRQEIAGVIEEEIVEARARAEVELLAEIEESELLVIGGWHFVIMLRVRLKCRTTTHG